MVPILTGESAAVGAGGTVNYRLGCGSDLTSSGTEANRAVIYRTAGTISRLYTTILTNDRGASTLRVRKNGADGNLSIAIGASTTGEFEDTTNSDTAASGDVFNTRVTTGAGGTTFTFRVIRAVFQSTTDTVTILGCSGINVTGANVFAPLGNSTGSAGTESNNQHTSPIAFTWKNFGVFVSANTRDAAITYLTRRNTANGNQTVSIGSTLTGWFEDLVNTDSVAVGDLINYQGVTAGTAGTVTVQIVKTEALTTNKQFLIPVSGNAAIAAATTTYTLRAGNFSENATESNQVSDAGAAYTFSRLSCLISANTVNEASTYRFRKNAANGNIAVSVTGLTTGHFTDTTNTDPIAVSDSLAYQMVTGATGTSLTMRTAIIGGTLSGGGSGNLLMMGVG